MGRGRRPEIISEDSWGEVRLCRDVALAAREAQGLSDHPAAAALHALDLRLQDLASALPAARDVASEPIAAALADLSALL